MCSAQCDSGIPGDVHYETCSNTCQESLAPAVCTMCRCRGCSFCGGDSTAPALLLPPSGSSACVPFNNKDTNYQACSSHCNVASKATHCETCKCKVCILIIYVKLDLGPLFAQPLTPLALITPWRGHRVVAFARASKHATRA